MTYQAKAELFKTYHRKYLQAKKKEKTRILTLLTEAAGYSRKHAIYLLNNSTAPKKKISRKRSSRYKHLYDVLRKIWVSANFICGKRLQPFLPEFIKALKQHKEIIVNKEEESLLLSISPATIDRLLAPAKKGLKLKGRSTTKPGTLLKHKIPIRTFADWNDTKPGFLEVDLVAHCGESVSGEYINTLNMTDIASGWAVCAPFMGRSEKFCVQAFEKTKARLPFQILGIDSDNDAPFINAHLLRYCERNNITFTRGRPYKKNDQCHIEQKNWDIIRKMVGYARFETEEQLELLKRIYNLLELYQNYFQPSRKLINKERIGSKVRKKYDTAQTPCQRLLASKDISAEVKAGLRKTFCGLNPAQLLRNIQELISELYKV